VKYADWPPVPHSKERLNCDTSSERVYERTRGSKLEIFPTIVATNAADFQGSIGMQPPTMASGWEEKLEIRNPKFEIS
jgi:hypothetical protein